MAGKQRTRRSGGAIYRITPGQQVIAAPVGELLATKLQGGAQRRVAGANRHAMLEVLDRALAWILIPQVGDLVAMLCAQQFRASLREHIGISKTRIGQPCPLVRPSSLSERRQNAVFLPTWAVWLTYEAFLRPTW